MKIILTGVVYGHPTANGVAPQTSESFVWEGSEYSILSNFKDNLMKFFQRSVSDKQYGREYPSRYFGSIVNIIIEKYKDRWEGFVPFLYPSHVDNLCHRIINMVDPIPYGIHLHKINTKGD